MKKQVTKDFSTKQKLPNGLRIVFHEMPWADSLTAELRVGAGSRFETEKNSGISHFLEHMFFEGTEKYPNNYKLNKAVTAGGGYTKAYTSKEFVTYQTKFPKENELMAVDFLYEIIFNSLIRENDAKKEKGIVVQELKKSNDNPESYQWDIMLDFIWSENHPLGRNILGSLKSIKSMNSYILHDFRKNFYTPDNMIVAIAGKFDQKKILDRITETFGNLTKSDKSVKSAPVNPLKFYERKSKIKLVNKPDLDEARVMLSFLGTEITHTHPDLISYKVLNSILTNKFFNLLVYELGLSYSSFADLWTFSDHGLQSILAGVSNDKILSALNEIVNNIRGLKITDELLEEGKNELKKSMFLNLADSDDYVDFVAEQEFFKGYTENPEQIKNAIDGVTKEKIVSIANNLLQYKNVSLVIIGKVKNTEKIKFEKILKKLPTT